MGEITRTPSEEHESARASEPPGRAKEGRERETKPRFGLSRPPSTARSWGSEGEAPGPADPSGAVVSGTGETWSSLADMLVTAINREGSGELPAVDVVSHEEEAARDARGLGVPAMDSSSAPPAPSVGAPATAKADRVAAEPEAPAVSEPREVGTRDEGRDTFLFDKPVRRKSRLGDPAQLIDGRYRIVRPLRDGGMARIFEVEHVDLGKHFALKVVHRRMNEDPQVRQMFLREAKVTSALDHPNIVAVTDFGVDDNIGAYIVMEFLQGQTLYDRLREQRMPISAAMEVMLQTAQALHYMHRRNLIHCDVKSENVFLCQAKDGARNRILVKLIDFGLSKAEATDAKLARSEVGGTPEYIAPEQIRGIAPQASMDIYALGVLFFEILTGHLPFSGTPHELLKHHLHTEPTMPRELLDEPPDEQLEQFVLQLLAKDPQLRPASLGQVIYHLRTLASMMGLRKHPLPRTRTGSVPVQQTRELLNLRAIFRHSPVPLFRLSAEGTVLAANSAFTSFVSADPKRLVGSNIEECRLIALCPEISAVLRDARESGHARALVRSVTFHLAAEPVSVRVMLLPEADEDGGVYYFTGVIHSLNPV